MSLVKRGWKRGRIQPCSAQRLLKSSTLVVECLRLDSHERKLRTFKRSSPLVGESFRLRVAIHLPPNSSDFVSVPQDILTLSPTRGEDQRRFSHNLRGHPASMTRRQAARMQDSSSISHDVPNSIALVAVSDRFGAAKPAASAVGSHDSAPPAASAVGSQNSAHWFAELGAEFDQSLAKRRCNKANLGPNSIGKGPVYRPRFSPACVDAVS